MKTVITGSSRGLGLEIARTFVKAGMEVAITSRSREGLEKAMSSLGPGSDDFVMGSTVDFGDVNSVISYAEWVRKEMGSIQVLVNNVGIYMEDGPFSYREEDLAKMMEVNVLSAMRMCSAFRDDLVQSKGYIVNIVSIAAKKVRPDAVTYSMSKAALSAYTAALRESLRQRGVKVTAIYPDAINTSSWDGVDVDRSRLIQPQDISTSILNLVQMNVNTVVGEIVIETNSDF